MTELAEDDIESVRKELKSLVDSAAKFQILLDSSNGLDSENLESRYNFTPYTIGENKDELITDGLLKENNGEILPTKRGSHIINSLLDLHKDFLLDNRVRPFFEYIDCSDEYVPDVGLFAQDTELLRESDDLDLTVKNNYKECLEASDSLRELFPFPLGLSQGEELKTLKNDKFEAEYIISEDFLSKINNRAHYQKRLYEYASVDDVSWFVSESLPYMLTIFDNEVIFTTDDGRLKLSLVSRNEEVREWATTKYNNILDSADKLDISASNGDVTISRNE